jgi:hypothetical protein
VDYAPPAPPNRQPYRKIRKAVPNLPKPCGRKIFNLMKNPDPEESHSKQERAETKAKQSKQEQRKGSTGALSPSRASSM